jgi:hypothetical protein
MRPYSGAVFGREKTSGTEKALAATPVVEPKAGGKGRPTPSRKEAEARNRRPLLGAPPPPKGATREERKASRQARNATVREERARVRAAQARGDESALAPKDRGPVRRYVRDYVDARRNFGEYFLPVALFALVVGVINVPVARLLSLALLYVFVVVIAVDSFLLNRKVKKLTAEKFAGRSNAGVGTYAMMRALQFRRGRMPKVQVERGQYPR